LIGVQSLTRVVIETINAYLAEQGLRLPKVAKVDA